MKNKTFNRLEVFCFFTYALYLFSKMFVCVNFINPIMKYVRVIAYILLIIIFFIQVKKYSLKQFIILIIIFIPISISCFITNDESLLALLLFIYSFQTINFDDFIKFDLIIRIFFILMVVSLYYLGFTSTYTMIRDNGQLRYSMGFSHPNMFGTYIFSIVTDIFYLCHSKRKLFPIFICICLLLSVYFLSNSRTSIICITLIILLMFLKDNRLDSIIKKFQKYKFSKHMFLIFTCVTYFLIYIYRLKIGISFFLNNLFSGRISGMNNLISTYGFRLFGNKIDFISTQDAHLLSLKSICLDNSFLYLLIVYGIIPFIIIYYIMYRFERKTFKNNNKKMYILFVIHLIFGLMESNIFTLSCNAQLLYLADDFLGNKETKD